MKIVGHNIDKIHQGHQLGIVKILSGMSNVSELRRSTGCLIIDSGRAGRNRQNNEGSTILAVQLLPEKGGHINEAFLVRVACRKLPVNIHAVVTMIANDSNHRSYKFIKEIRLAT